MDIAASSMPFTRAPAIAAASILVVFQAVRRYASAIRSHHTTHLRQALSQHHFRSTQPDGALENAVGQVIEIFFVARDTQVEIDLVVVGRYVGVRDGPVFAIAVVAPGFEVVIGEAQPQASPNIRLASQTARAGPGVRRAGIWVVLFVYD